MFKRRTPRTYLQSIREFFYPKSGWKRAIEYFKHRLKRLPDTPHRIALGLAVGAFVCFLPFFGLHFVLAALLAFVLRGNVLASLIGTFVGNPLTFPFIAALSYRLGLFILGGQEDEDGLARLRRSFGDALETMWDTLRAFFGYAPSRLDSFVDFWWSVLWPYTVGGVLPGLVVGFAMYFATKPLIIAYQTRRKGRLVAKLKELRKKASGKGVQE